MGEQAPEPRVIAQDRVKAEMRHFEALCVNEPCGIGLRADRPPDFLAQIIRGGLVDDCLEDHAEHVGFDAGVIKCCSGWSNPPVELNNAGDGTLRSSQTE